MSQQSFEEMYRSSQWLIAVQTQQSFALTISRMCSGEFAELILRETMKFTEQVPPRSPDEVALRQRQASAVISKASTIAHADSMSRIVPGAAPQILKLASEYCTGDLPKTDAEFQRLVQATSDLTANISRLCFADWSPQI